MRTVSFRADNSTRQPAHWSLSRLLTTAAVFATPFALLLIKLHAESIDGSVPAGADALPIRFSVVGLFAVLMARWYITWIQRQR